jgi:cold shock CspA family protein
VRGTVQYVRTDRRYAFIKPDVDGRPNLFMHERQIRHGRFKDLVVGCRVDYQEGYDREGRPHAEFVVILRAEP